MSRTIAIYTTIALLGVAVFGFLGIGFMNAHHASCIVSISRGGFCPEQFDPLGFINFHFNALKGFSTAVFGAGLQAILFLVLLVAASVMFFAPAPAPFVAKKATNSKLPAGALSPDDLVFQGQRQFIRWLSLHENSPALFAAAR